MTQYPITSSHEALTAYGQPLETVDKDFIAPQASEVILKVHHCGVCHSDVHLHEGYFDLGNERKFPVNALHHLPHTLGHEIEGEVVAVGPDVKDAKPGDRRIVYAWIGCETCHLCKSGKSHLCNQPRQIGINTDGGFATHILVPDAQYLISYDGIAPEQAGSYMCAGLTAFGALKKIKNRTEQGPVMIIGAGGVGLMALQFAKQLFSEPPIIAEIDPQKRELAMKLGAKIAIDPKDRDARKALIRDTEGGLAGAVDFVGNTQSVDFGVACLGRGGLLVICGLFGGEFSYPIPYIPFKSIAIEGSYVGSLSEAHEMMEIAKTGVIAPLPVTLSPLSKATEALTDLREGRVTGRTVLTCSA